MLYAAACYLDMFDQSQMLQVYPLPSGIITDHSEETFCWGWSCARRYSRPLLQSFDGQGKDTSCQRNTCRNRWDDPRTNTTGALHSLRLCARIFRTSTHGRERESKDTRRETNLTPSQGFRTQQDQRTPPRRIQVSNLTNFDAVSCLIEP